jgi:hypothetical protein
MSLRALLLLLLLLLLRVNAAAVFAELLSCFISHLLHREDRVSI